MKKFFCLNILLPFNGELKMCVKILSHNKTPLVVLIHSLSSRSSSAFPSQPSRFSNLRLPSQTLAALPVPRCVINWSASAADDNRKKMACRESVPVDTAGGVVWLLDGVELTPARVNHSITATRIAGSERKVGNYRFSSDAVDWTAIRST